MRLPAKSVAVALTLLSTAYLVNYFVTPDLVGAAKLEVFYRPRGKLEFDPQLWRAGGEAGKRYGMIDDLLTRKTLVGLSTAELEGLLGKPDSVTNDAAEQLFFYFLGEQRAFPSKSIWFPGLFPNHENWMLEIRIRNGRFAIAKVFFT